MKKFLSKASLAYIGIVGGLTITGLVLYGVSQYYKAKSDASNMVVEQAEGKLNSLENKDRNEEVQDEIDWYQDLKDVFTVLNKRKTTIYKATAIPAYVLTTGSLVAFGLCLMHADKQKEKEEDK